MLPSRLRRVFLLLNAKHGITPADTAMLQALDAQCHEHASSRSESGPGAGATWTLQAVLTKLDAVPPSEVKDTITRLREEIWRAAPTCLPPLLTSAAMSPPFGVEAVRAAIVEACGVRKAEVSVR